MAPTWRSAIAAERARWFARQNLDAVNGLQEPYRGLLFLDRIPHDTAKRLQERLRHEWWNVPPDGPVAFYRFERFRSRERG